MLAVLVTLFSAGLGSAVYVSTLPNRAWMVHASAPFPHSPDIASEVGLAWVQDEIPVVTEPEGASVYAGAHDLPTLLCMRTPCWIPTTKVSKLDEAALVLPGYETATVSLRDVLRVPGGGEIRHSFERRPLASMQNTSPSISIREGRMVVNGPVPVEIVQRFVRQHYGSFHLCYEKALEKQPKAEGRIVVGFTIAEAGEVRDVVVKNATLQVSGFGDCIRGGFRTLSFSTAEKPTKVDYDLSFAPPSS